MLDSSGDLFAKDCSKSSPSDKFKEMREQVSLVGFSKLLSGDTERLAGQACRADGSINRSSGELQGVVPPADTCEKVVSGKSSKIVCFNI